MNYFETQMFNPAYVNESYYHQQQMKSYMADQDERVAKVVHSLNDMLDQVNGMDQEHQQLAFLLCLAEMAIRYGWK